MCGASVTLPSLEETRLLDQPAFKTQSDARLSTNLGKFKSRERGGSICFRGRPLSAIYAVGPHAQSAGNGCGRNHLLVVAHQRDRP
jgi:hypothetical protein